MDVKNYEGTRWAIVMGKYEGIEKYAVNELYKVIQQYVPYVLTVNNDNIESQKLKDYNVIFIGTSTTNSYIAQFVNKGIIKPNMKKEEYTIKTCQSTFNTEREMIILAGADENGVLYAVRDFEHYYSDSSRYLGEHYYNPYKPFIEKMPEYEVNSSPAVENRGLWTWGHVIYDYKRYLDNMSKWKMNIITIWNDFAPLNAKDVVDYAHSRGIKVVWGFSWCWGEKVNPTAVKELEKWSDRVISTYEEQYAGLGGDGIYFQTFTETKDTLIEGISIAELVTNWVNNITGKLLEKHPDLWVQFGLHATSVMNEFKTIRKIDPRINITWEDTGSFPFFYDAKETGQFPETYDFTSKISELRGNDEDFGIVLKGLTVLNWTAFEHQKGIFILGESNDMFRRDRVQDKLFFWRYAQAYWIKNLKHTLDIIKMIASKDIKKLSVMALVEDGMWEEHLWYPVALFAESLWNPYEEVDELVKKVSLTKDAYFA